MRKIGQKILAVALIGAASMGTMTTCDAGSIVGKGTSTELTQPKTEDAAKEIADKVVQFNTFVTTPLNQKDHGYLVDVYNKAMDEHKTLTQYVLSQDDATRDKIDKAISDLGVDTMYDFESLGDSKYNLVGTILVSRNLLSSMIGENKIEVDDAAITVQEDKAIVPVGAVTFTRTLELSDEAPTPSKNEDPIVFVHTHGHWYFDVDPKAVDDGATEATDTASTRIFIADDKDKNATGDTNKTQEKSEHIDRGTADKKAGE